MRRILIIFSALLLASVIGYGLYAFGGAEKRMQQLCTEITPGLQFSALKELSLKRDVNAPYAESGTNYLVERKSFGRWGCKVVLENGVVKSSEFTFAD